mmetsp:Transcript_14483/g.42274  ORF Transcript_14483/g.42274 Transcript_14483/m.42274 type:complete len:102 (+) Transcript_14483:792-1097(+)
MFPGLPAAERELSSSKFSRLGVDVPELRLETGVWLAAAACLDALMDPLLASGSGKGDCEDLELLARGAQGSLRVSGCLPLFPGSVNASDKLWDSASSQLHS